MEKSMISLCLLGGLAIGNGFAQTPSKPNILLIIADDCSYYDIGCFGAVNNKTPHIDALARQGIKFNSAYNSVSMSTPTRHCVYTGMYPMHHGGALKIRIEKSMSSPKRILEKPFNLR